MTQPLNDNLLLSLKFFLKDDINALKYCIDLLFISHLWDDLIDQDVNRTAEEINQAFIKSLGEIPLNPFYMAYQQQLAPMQANALTLWLESNTMESGDNDSQLAALHIRNAVLHIIHWCIVLLGGIQWAREVGPEFWRLFGMTEEKQQTFLQEVRHAA